MVYALMVKFVKFDNLSKIHINANSKDVGGQPMFSCALNRALKILPRSCDQFQKISKSLEFIIFIQFPWGDSVLFFD